MTKTTPGDTAAAWLGAYNQAALKDGERGVDEKLLAVQARRSALIFTRIGPGQALVLPDPVGSGKTAVALVAAAMLLDAGTVRRVVVVAPSQAVKRMWEKRKKWLVHPTSGKTVPPKAMTVVTRRELGRQPVKRDGVLAIVDEAHRGLQAEGGFHEKLESWTEGCSVLLLTATPFLLSSQGLVTMLRIGSSGDEAKAPVEAYGRAVTALATKYRAAVTRQSPNPTEDPSVVSALEAAVAKRPKAIAALERRILPPDPQLARLRGDVPPLVNQSVEVKDEWQEAYHVARVVPELVDTGKGDMFNRRLLSCSEAFWGGKAGQALCDAALRSSRVSDFVDDLRRQLGEGIAHPKVAATARWVADRIQKGRHVLVFCVFAETQTALAGAIAQEIGRRGADAVKAPSGDRIPDKVALRFQAEPGEDGALALVVQDRFSESIDLDGGRPCLVHHDLPWTPARITQRWGRVVRAGTRFEPVAPEDIYVPVLELNADTRLFETVIGRAGIGELLLPRGVQAERMDEDADEYALPDELLYRLGSKG
jgi:hypothetical protein